uniref:Transcription initiation factor TFIID subunit 10 n=1 Tax=Anopheles quadriannulatus TaxID=34691 RepID=A0A182X5Y8_ANOQN
MAAHNTKTTRIVRVVPLVYFHFSPIFDQFQSSFASKMGDNFGIHRGQGKKVSEMVEDRTQGQVLSDFMMQLEDYTPTIPDAVTSFYLNSAGFEGADPRIVRLISIAAQKFVSDVANDALQHCKTRTNSAPSSGHGSSKNQNQKSSKDRKYTLTMEDLQPALNDYGITVRKAHYFV